LIEPAQPLSAAGVRRAYRFYARHYNMLFGAVLEPGRRALAEAVARLAPRTVLEVGVGTGLTLWRYPPTAAVTGIDLSAEMLAVARRRLARLPGRRIALLAMDAEAMAFPDGSFDCVTLPYVLSVTPDPARLVAEVRRVCRPDGTILILNHFSGSRSWWLLERLLRPAAERIGFRSDFRLDEQVLRHGWEVRAMRKVNLLGLSTLVEIRNREAARMAPPCSSTSSSS
jgi:phosphatidylethanolamine/phosphatidyl-N-methylethanolamine N-methyltransferase